MRVLAVVLLFNLAPTAQGEDCIIPPNVTPNAVGYGHAMIAGLGYFQEAGQLEISSTGDTEIERTAGQIAFFKQRAAKMACIAEVLDGFKSVKDPAMSQHRIAINAAVLDLIQVDKEWVKTAKAILDGYLTKGALAERMAELKTKNEEALKSVPRATAVGTYVFVDLNQDKKGILRITEKERVALLDDLVRTLGPSVKVGLKAGQDSYTAAGAILYGFLANSDWVTRAE